MTEQSTQDAHAVAAAALAQAIITRHNKAPVEHGPSLSEAVNYVAKVYRYAKVIVDRGGDLSTTLIEE